MSALIGWMDSTFYSRYDRNWDDILFRQIVLDAIDSTAVILDLGAGAGIVSQMNFRGEAVKVCGVDLDPRVVDNPMLDEGRVADAGMIPYSSETFDVVFADNVMEHIADPVTVLKEVRRVLKPGGVFLFKTPNRRHYMPLVARMTPHSFHRWINRLRGRADVDTFPTLYKINTSRDIRLAAMAAGLEVARIDLIEGRPEYLRMTAITYLVGLLYERLVNSTSALAGFRILLVAELRKSA